MTPQTVPDPSKRLRRTLFRAFAARPYPGYEQEMR